MDNNKYKKLTEWIADNYQPLSNWIYFNATIMEAGNTSLNTMEGQDATQTFNDGSKEVNLPFAIAMIKAYDAEMSDTNLDAIKEIDHFIEWLNTQDVAQNFPDLGGNITVFGLDVLDSSPSVSVDNEQNLAKYQFNCTINYLEQNII